MDTQPQTESQTPTAPPSPQVTYHEAGMFAAWQLLKTMGRPGATAWFMQNAPSPDEDSVALTGKPMEFWVGMHHEIMSVAGTA